jgi:hypothetical protein
MNKRLMAAPFMVLTIALMAVCDAGNPRHSG